MPTLLIPLRRRRWMLLGGLGVTAIATVWPRAALAGCRGDGGLAIPDFGACVDAVQYNAWRGLALWFWQGDQALLLGAHQLDQLRWFVVERLFLTLYQTLVNFLEPLLGSLASLALTLALFALMLVPVFGEVIFGSVRQILILLILLPVLFASLGPWVVEGERLRASVASDLFRSLPPDLPSSLFGARAAPDRDMRAVTPLDYTACGDAGVVVPRTGVGVQDLAAALLWADWRDIACPQRAGSELPEFPALWSRPAPEGAGYLYPGDLGDLNDAHLRAQYIAGAQQAVARASWALIPAMLALAEAGIQFTLSLCTVLLALAGLLSSVAALFQRRLSGLVVFVQGAWRVVQTGILSSLLLGFFTLALLAAASAGSAASCFALAGVSLVLAVCLLLIALWICKDCFLLAGAGIGMNSGQAAAAAGTVLGSLPTSAGMLGGSVGALTPSLQPALAGASALAAGAGLLYAAGYSLANSRSPLARAGSLAALMRGNPAGRFAQGVRAGATTHGSPLSPHAIQRVRRDVAAQQARSAAQPGALPAPASAASPTPAVSGAARSSTGGAPPRRVNAQMRQQQQFAARQQAAARTTRRRQQQLARTPTSFPGPVQPLDAADLALFQPTSATPQHAGKPIRPLKKGSARRRKGGKP
ncbi:MAG TPA: hypothetical protein VFS21_30025 [Roseiflexaceae bacterium]|nr:hypothetical protein [Roseiflexaceae bacterium]